MESPAGDTVGLELKLCAALCQIRDTLVLPIVVDVHFFQVKNYWKVLRWASCIKGMLNRCGQHYVVMKSCHSLDVNHQRSCRTIGSTGLYVLLKPANLDPLSATN